jgi:uncharacterized protein with NAD-binding domain and iron-sulfur cluster
VQGDYYLLAVPVEVADKLFSPKVIDADSTLGGVKKLAESVAWMNGMQFYLSEVVDVVHGHCIYSDSPWAITSISQLPFWKDYNIEERFEGKVKSILSIDISDWESPGILKSTGGKTASECSYKEIKDEVWEQLKQSLNVDGKEIIKDEQIVHWYIDRDIKVEHQKKDLNKEPLLVNTTNSWDLRPEAYTSIPNLFLASDYVRTYTDLATMEGANEAARRAVNAIIESSGVKSDYCEIWNLHEPDILAGMRRRDQKRFDKGLPYKESTPWWVKLLLAIYRLFKKSE